MQSLRLITHPKIVGHAFLIPLMIQAAIFHPYYQNKPSFRLARRALTPIIIHFILNSVQDRLWEPLGECMMINFPFVSLVTFHAICLAIQLGFYDGPVFKSKSKIRKKETLPDETSAEESKDEALLKDSDTLDESKSLEKENLESAAPIDDKSTADAISCPSWGKLVRFVVWLLLSPRSLEFAWAPSASVLKHREPISIQNFLIENLCRIFRMHLHGMIFWTIAVHAFHHQDGIYGILTQSIGLPPSKALEIASGYGLPFCLGAAMWSAMEIASCAVSVIEAAFWPAARKILPTDWAPEDEFDPTRYPTLFNMPWARETMCEFWGQGWHALFRRDLVFCAALPMAKLFQPFGKSASQIAGLLGAMGLSAFMHEYAISSISRAPWDYPIVAFFINCSLVMIVEVLLERHTKYKIRGAFGLLWTYGWLMYLGKPGLDLWIQRGLGAGMTPVSQWSWKRFVFPAGTLMPNEWLDVFIPF